MGWNGSDICAEFYAAVEEVVGGPVESINLMQYGSSTVLDVKYYDGSNLVDVTLQVDGTTIWQV